MQRLTFWFRSWDSAQSPVSVTLSLRGKLAVKRNNYNRMLILCQNNPHSYLIETCDIGNGVALILTSLAAIVSGGDMIFTAPTHVKVIPNESKP